MSRVRPRDRYGRLLPRGSKAERADAGQPEELVDSAREACRRGIALFDEQRFFEAHEFFEYAWKADDVDDRDRGFWKGVTQVAVGCCHAQRGNRRGALALLDRASDYLQRFPSPHWDVDTAALVSVAQNVAAQVRQRGASASLDFPRFPVVPPRGHSPT